MRLWTTRQFGRIFDEFRAECPPAAWDDLLIAYAALKQNGPMAGPLVAKKLRHGKGIWELIAHADNAQPRVLFFYFSAGTIVFVHAFMKKGKNDYKDAIRLAQKRRAQIERQEKATNEFNPKHPVH
jgi:phage-related protein